jgi:hypothetical protein
MKKASKVSGFYAIIFGCNLVDVDDPSRNFTTSANATTVVSVAYAKESPVVLYNFYTQ